MIISERVSIVNRHGFVVFSDVGRFRPGDDEFEIVAGDAVSCRRGLREGTSW